MPGHANGHSIIVSNTVTLINSIVGGESSFSNCGGIIMDGGHTICLDRSANFTALTSRNNLDDFSG